MFPWYIKYPNQNDEILNLDWILSTIENLVKETDNFINLNTIKYADPILWNIEKQYEANTVVIDGSTGNAYISTKAVPSGVQISRTEYWTQIFNYADELHRLRMQIAFDEGIRTTASRSFSVGDLVFVNDLLYRVIAPMIEGDSFVVDSNIQKVDIELLLNELKADITSEASARADADTALQQAISAEALARADADTTLQQAISDEATARGEAIAAEAAARGEAIAAEAAARAAADNDIRNIISTNDNFINVKLFNAVGDGVTDDTAAISNAISLARQQKTNVYFPSGNYLISTINVVFDSQSKNVSLFGNGNSSIITVTENGINFINESEASVPNYCVVEKLHFVGANSTARLLQYVNIFNGTVRDCQFDGGYYGLVFASNIWGLIQNCRFNLQSRDGIFMCGNENDNRCLYGGNNAITILQCVVQGAGHSGLYDIGGCGISIYGSTFEANTVCGIQVEKSGGFNGQGILVSGGWFEYNPSGHIYIDSRFDATDCAHNIIGCGFIADSNQTADSVTLIGTNGSVCVEGCHFRRLENATAISISNSPNCRTVHNSFSYSPVYTELNMENNDKSIIKFNPAGTSINNTKDLPTSVTKLNTGSYRFSCSHWLTYGNAVVPENGKTCVTILTNEANNTCTVTVFVKTLTTDALVDPTEPIMFLGL